MTGVQTCALPIFLTVYDMWKVRTLLHQVMTTKKRKMVGTDFYTFEDEPDTATEAHGVDKYLALLHTYLLALAIAGSNKLHGAPSEETFGSDSTKFVRVPWDVMQAYLFRASRAVMLLPESSRLPWLEGRDIAEGAAWVSAFREGEEPLGQIVQSVMEKRSAHWDTPIQSVITRPPPAAHSQSQFHQPRAAQDPKKQRQGNQKGSGKNKTSFPPAPPSSPSKLPPGSAASALRDGTTLCPDFNKGKCHSKGPSCSKGAHKCSKVTRGGRPCGMSFHGAHTCRNA